MMRDPSTSLPAIRSRRLPVVLALPLGVALMTLAAKVQVPFWPVPMTLHTMAVMGFAAFLGPRRAATIFLAYLAAGAAGLPVFSGTPERGIGLAYMVGPTGGYLAGYLVACALVGHLAAGRGALGRFAAMLAGLVPVYALGAAWLTLFVPASEVFATGVAPFVPGDVVKIAILTAVFAALARRTAAR
ncbi:biotin transporter BioY [Aureimonas flava]|uniref:Biotin transporter n=1 Tax=Aureimonas flava TaxID=2320271 RepID=A0A3A1WQJ6_9HYPH|nr:biotin transporter BioY [Aureimonas flava]RIX99168.1 biotin transporter BioY [Aureimonas flava]